MPETPRPPATPADASDARVPSTPLEYYWFDGVLDGGVGDADALRTAATAIDGLGLSRAHLDLEGGRFTLMLEPATVQAGGAAAPLPLESLAEHLQRVVDGAAEPAAVRSSLRCTAVFGDAVVETLFATSGGRIHGVRRTRSPQGEDRRRAPRPPARIGWIAEFGRGKALFLTGLMTLAFTALVWKSGILERIYATDAAALACETGVFGAELAVSVEPVWGNYRVVVARGEGFPQDAAAAERQVAASLSLAERAALRAVSEGRTVFAHVLDEQGTSIAFAPVSLAPLLRAPDAVADAFLPGSPAAAAVTVALEPGDLERR